MVVINLLLETVCRTPFAVLRTSIINYLWKVMIRIIKYVLGKILLVPIYFYRWFISPLTGASCRHTPSCSQYAIDAIRNLGPLHGLWLGTGRFLRCRPGGTHGYDPAPVIWARRYKPLENLLNKPKHSNRLKR